MKIESDNRAPLTRFRIRMKARGMIRAMDLLEAIDAGPMPGCELVRAELQRDSDRGSRIQCIFTFEHLDHIRPIDRDIYEHLRQHENAAMEPQERNGNR